MSCKQVFVTFTMKEVLSRKKSLLSLEYDFAEKLMNKCRFRQNPLLMQPLIFLSYFFFVFSFKVKGCYSEFMAKSTVLNDSL